MPGKSIFAFPIKSKIFPNITVSLIDSDESLELHLSNCSEVGFL